MLSSMHIIVRILLSYKLNPILPTKKRVSLVCRNGLGEEVQRKRVVKKRYRLSRRFVKLERISIQYTTLEQFWLVKICG